MKGSLLAVILAAGLGAPRASAAPGAVSFEVDARVELLSVVIMLSDPDALEARRAPLDAYAASARAAFSKHARHPAVARVAALRREGASTADLAGAGLDLRDFEKASGFAAFFARSREAHAAFADTARRESLHALSPESALAYMGLPFEGETRFILAPLLPDEPGLDALRVRGATSEGGRVRFRFDELERSAAAQRCAASADWLRPPSGVLAEHLCAAVALRVVAADLGERVYADALRRLASDRLPRLRAVAERLKEYEADRARFSELRSFTPRVPAFAELRVEQAASAARAGGRAQALLLLAEAREQNPDVETGRRIMLLYHDLGEDAAAKAVSDALLEAAPADTDVLLDRAALAAKAGDRASALALLRRAPRGDASRRMLDLYLDLKEYAPAGRLLDAMIAAAPERARPRLDRALVHARLGDRAAARRSLAEAAARRPSSGERRQAATLLVELEDAAAAAELLDALIRENPADGDVKTDRAALAAQAGDRAAALRLLGEAGGLSPGPAARHRIALLYQDLGDEVHGRDLMDELIKSSPLDARLRIDRASHAARRGERAAALAFLAEARALNPALEERRLMVALHQSLDDHQAAQGLLAGLIAAAPKDPGLLVDRAALALRSGDQAATRADLAAARALRPEPADLRRMALLHQDLKEYPQALALLAPLAREQPANASLLSDLGLCEYLAGHPEEAIVRLRAAVNLDPASLPAIVTLGSIYAAQGRFAEERAVYDAAPASGGTSELRAVLERARREAVARNR